MDGLRLAQKQKLQDEIDKISLQASIKEIELNNKTLTANQAVGRGID